MSARVHNTTQRATPADRKVVFKSVLDNPFQIPWPHVPLNLQNAALASLVTVLTGVAEYHIARQAAGKKRKRARHDKARKEKAAARKKRKVGDEGISMQVDTQETATAVEDVPAADPVPMDTDPEPDAEPQLPPVPPVFSHLLFGINEVTKRLESQSSSRRLRISITIEEPPAPDPEPEPLIFVFVCRADVDPPLLIAHLPDLVAACNIPSSNHPHTPVQLIPLPKHAEQILADAVGLRRVSVLALDATTPSLTALSTLLASVQPPSAPWLTGPITSHIPTHIKQLRTTAPRDMRVAKRARTEGRQAAKEKQKTKQQGHVKKNGNEREKKRIKIVAPSKDLLAT